MSHSAMELCRVWFPSVCRADTNPGIIRPQHTRENVFRAPLEHIAAEARLWTTVAGSKTCSTPRDPRYAMPEAATSFKSTMQARETDWLA